MDTSEERLATTLDAVREVGNGNAPVTADEIASALDCSPGFAAETLDALAERGLLEGKDVGPGGRVWWRPPGSATDDRTALRSLIDAVEEYAIFMLDPDGRIATWNAGAKRIKGYDVEEIVGEHFSTFYTEEDREAGVPERNLEAARETGLCRDEGWRVRADGSTFRADVTISPIRSDDGTLTGFAKVTRDMTDRHEREQELRRERDLIDRLFETSPVGLAVLDANGSFTRANTRAEELLGVRLDEPNGSYRTEDRAVYDSDGKRIPPAERPFAHVFRTGDAIENEQLQIDAEDGSRRWISVSATPLRTDGGIDRVVVAGEDITWLKKQTVRLERRRDELEGELAEIFERIDDAFFGLDPDWNFTYLNSRAEELILPDDRSAGDVVGNTIWEEYPEAVGTTFETEYRRAMETGESTTFEEYYPPLGAWFEVHAYPSETGLSVYFRDVSARKEREEELRRYETTIQTLDDGIYALDADSRFTTVNDAYVEMTGRSREELLGEPASVIHSERLDETAAELVREAATDGETHATIRAEIRSADGETIPVESRMSPYPTDGGQGRVGVVRDITERRKREREIQARIDQLDAIAELGRLALAESDLDELLDETARTVADVLDNEFCEVLELDEDGDELALRAGVGWRDGLVGETAVGTGDGAQAGYTLCTDVPVVVEDYGSESRFSAPELHSSHGVVSGITVVIGTPDEPWGVLGTHDDSPADFNEQDVHFVQTIARILATTIERRERRERLRTTVAQLERSNERLERFAYITSHDLQEPVRMISSYLQLLEMRYADELDEDAEEFIDFAVGGAERIRNMIHDLLTYSRIDSRGGEFELTDVNDVLDDVRRELHRRIEETDAEITADDLPTVSADADQLARLFEELIDNALTYRSEDPPRIHVGVECRDGTWRFSVSDEGVGIDPEYEDRIFEIFRRLHRDDEHEGTGAGLALCQRIVERHGGEIRVESEPGEGATFYFALD